MLIAGDRDVAFAFKGYSRDDDRFPRPCGAVDYRIDGVDSGRLCNRGSGRSLPSEERRHIVNAAQQIAESIRLDRHRDSWTYTRAITAQRTKVLAHRHEVATTARAREELDALIPGHLNTLELAGRDGLIGTLRDVALFYLDDHWAKHLAILQEVRDGIHLRSLAGQKPADEFHKFAVRQFPGFLDTVYRDAATFVKGLKPHDVGQNLEGLGLKRPSATWAYMVTADPFGSPIDRAARTLGKHWRSKVLRIE